MGKFILFGGGTGFEVNISQRRYVATRAWLFLYPWRLHCEIPTQIKNRQHLPANVRSVAIDLPADRRGKTR